MATKKTETTDMAAPMNIWNKLLHVRTDFYAEGHQASSTGE